MFKRILVFLFALALNNSAFAGSSTIGVTAGSGATYDVITDASGNFVGMFGLCDGTAAASCAAVTSGAVKIAGAGTAGTASGGVVTVQGVASMTPILSNPGTIGTWGLAAIGGTTGSPTNALAAGCQYNSSAPTFSTGDVGGIQCNVSGAVNVDVTNANANGQTTASGSSPVVLASNQSVADPCMFQAKTNLAISQNGTSSAQLIALSGSTSIYVCSISIIAAGATTVAFTTGTGSACVTGNAAVIGSTTTNIANSMSFAANGGWTLGNGTGTIAKGAASSELCMINGSNVYVSGNLTYVQQ